MRLCVISFTEKGGELSVKIRQALEENPGRKETREKERGGGKIEVDLYTKCKAFVDGAAHPAMFVTDSLGVWTKTQMEEKNALLFIGACGIAVRAVAPCLTDKLHDAPVLVMDEQGRYVIPILSGHMGGANELALYIAEKTGAEAVITTATDLNGKFAADLFARENGLSIINKDGIVRVSSKVLAGQEITMAIEPRHVEGCPPEGVRLVSYPPLEPVDVGVFSQGGFCEAALMLRPKEYIIGMGCKRGKSAAEIENFIVQKLTELGISDIQVYALSSISQKSDEQGLTAWCRKRAVPFLTYSAEELQEVEGVFAGSPFVREQVGVDNVCERAALKACGRNGKLICGKCKGNGMTIAVAKREWVVKF